jgi:hypothetical protein
MCRLRRSRWKKPRTREGAKSGVGRLGRMKVGSGIKVRVDKSSGIEIGMADAFAKNQPKTPLQICYSKQIWCIMKR